MAFCSNKSIEEEKRNDEQNECVSNRTCSSPCSIVVIDRTRSDTLKHVINSFLDHSSSFVLTCRFNWFSSAEQRRILQQSQDDPWKEIDRRNQFVLHPSKTKNIYETSHDYLISNSSQLELSNSTSYILPVDDSTYTQHSTQYDDDDDDDDADLNTDDSLVHCQRSVRRYHSNIVKLVCDSSIFQSNKADLIHRMNKAENHAGKINYHGITISKDGPFWPRDYRIIHPTPRLLDGKFLAKELYFTADRLFSSKSKTTNMKHWYSIEKDTIVNSEDRKDVSPTACSYVRFLSSYLSFHRLQ
jgi:hypothetical protein